MFQAIGIVIVVALVNPYLILPAIVLLIFTVIARGIYIKSARDIKRFEGLSNDRLIIQLIIKFL